MVELETLDEIHAIIGVRGSGKSTFMMELSLDLRARYGGYFIGHSPGAWLPTKLPDGRTVKIHWHDSMRALERGLRRWPDEHHIKVGGDPDEVVTYGRALARASVRRSIEKAGFRYKENRPYPPNVKAPPVFMLVDEGVYIEGAEKGSSKAEVKEWEKFLVSARHEHVGLIWGVQRPTSKNWVLLEQSTYIHTFHYSHEWGLNAIRASGVPKSRLDDISNLPKYEHLTFNRWDRTTAEQD